jgi:peptidoglycan/LPS O-acetylase OafA/YrhL
MTHPSPIAPIRLPNLDLLRIVAAVMIVVYHFGYRGPAQAGWTPSAYPEFAGLAQEMWAGVAFFFIISGFVIAWSAEKGDAWSFAVSRAARLYPAFVAAMTLTALGMTALGMTALAPSGVAEFQVTAARYVANLTMFSKVFGQSFMDGAYWSIVVEIIFYGWVALFLALGLFHRRQLTLLACWLALALLNELVLKHGAVQMLFITKQAGWFALGVLAYRAYAAGRAPGLREAALGVAALALCMIDDRAYVGWMQVTLGYAPAWSPAFAAAKIGVMLAALALAVRLPALLPPKVCLALGGLTYPLYLVHQNLGYAVMHGLDPVMGRWGALAGAVVVVTALAWLIHRGVEPAGRRIIMRTGEVVRGRFGALAAQRG